MGLWNTTGPASQFISVENIQATALGRDVGVVAIYPYSLYLTDNVVYFGLRAKSPVNATIYLKPRIYITGRWK